MDSESSQEVPSKDPEKNTPVAEVIEWLDLTDEIDQGYYLAHLTILQALVKFKLLDPDKADAVIDKGARIASEEDFTNVEPGVFEIYQSGICILTELEHLDADKEIHGPLSGSVNLDGLVHGLWFTAVDTAIATLPTDDYDSGRQLFIST